MVQMPIEPIAVNMTQAAALLGVSRPTMYALARSEGFPAVKIGGRVLVSVDGLREWMSRQISR